MPLSCNCDYYPEPGHTFWRTALDYTTLKTTKRKRCKSCHTLINIGSTILEFARAKVPNTDIEIKIYGEENEIPRARWYLCETCADLFLSLSELGFCVSPDENQNDLVAEYNTMRKQL